jgi:hypothetical protein
MPATGTRWLLDERRGPSLGGFDRRCNGPHHRVGGTRRAPIARSTRESHRGEHPVRHSQRRHRADQTPESEKAKEPEAAPDRPRVCDSHEIEALRQSRLDLHRFRHAHRMPGYPAWR